MGHNRTFASPVQGEVVAEGKRKGCFFLPNPKIYEKYLDFFYINSII